MTREEIYYFNNHAKGVAKIDMERNEQVSKHGRTIPKDVSTNGLMQLSSAASILCSNEWGCSKEDVIEYYCPHGWDKLIWAKMVNKSYEERLIIAGALIAAEIDRIDYIFNLKNDWVWKS